MIKWIGQHIVSLIARFRSDVYLESPTAGGSDPDKFLGIDSDNKIIYRTGVEVLSDIGGSSTTGDITQVALAGDSGTATVTTGSANFTIAGGTGITTNAGSTTVTINKDTSYSYVYMQIHGRSGTGNDNWFFQDASGDGEFNWETDSSSDAWDGSNSGIDNDGTNTTVDDTTLEIDRAAGVMGFVVPYDCTLIGFKCIGRDLSGDDAFKAGLWSSAPYSAYGGSTGTTEFTLRAIATSSYADGSGSNFNGICKLDDLTRSHDLVAGDILLPSISETDTNRTYISMTIVLKVPII